MQAIRDRSRVGTQVGPPENISVAIPAIATPKHIRAAELATRELNAPYLTALYREVAAGTGWPSGTAALVAGDLSTISAKSAGSG